MTSGVVYIATGKKYVDEAVQSAASLKSSTPHLPVTIFTDCEVNSSDFDQVICIKNNEYCRISKLYYMYRSPYERTLYIDSDTYVCADFSEVFTLLDKFDIALAHDPTRILSPIDGIPDSFPEMNGGIILFRKNAQVEKFFSDWLSLYQQHLKEKSIARDQVACRIALYNSDKELRIATLTPEYNCRFENVPFVHGEVKILHGRTQNQSLSALARKVNTKLVHRVIRKPKNAQATIVYQFRLIDRVWGAIKKPSRILKLFRLVDV